VLSPAIIFALLSLVIGGLNEVVFKRYSARERSRGMMISGVGVVWTFLLIIDTSIRGDAIVFTQATWWFGLVAGIIVAIANILLLESLRHMEVSLGSTIYRLNTIAVVFLSVIFLGATGSRASLEGIPRQLVAWTEPFHIANSYGLFAVMTTRRDEIVFEGSPDGQKWLPYELPYKPGALDRPPVWAAPHQPRLDWQLWFAALAPREQNPWLQGLIKGLLTGADPVLGLFEDNPFASEPPKFIRASLYRYRFTDWHTRRETGDWWTREYIGSFWPVTAWQLSVERATGPEG
jgi:uncharacterized membrane protein